LETRLLLYLHELSARRRPAPCRREKIRKVAKTLHQRFRHTAIRVVLPALRATISV
jgi:hypothetical protein